MTAPTNDRREVLAAVLGQHRLDAWREVRPDRFQRTCSCGELLDSSAVVAVAHQTHVAAALDAALTAQEGERGSWVCGRCGGAPEQHTLYGERGSCVYDPTWRAQEGERGGAEVADAVVVPRRLLRGLLDETDYEKSNALHGEAQALLADPAGALAKVKAEVWDAGAEAGFDSHAPDDLTDVQARNPYRADRIAGDQP